MAVRGCLRVAVTDGRRGFWGVALGNVRVRHRSNSELLTSVPPSPSPSPYPGLALSSRHYSTQDAPPPSSSSEEPEYKARRKPWSLRKLVEPLVRPLVMKFVLGDLSSRYNINTETLLEGAQTAFNVIMEKFPADPERFRDVLTPQLYGQWKEGFYDQSKSKKTEGTLSLVKLHHAKIVHASLAPSDRPRHDKTFPQKPYSVFLWVSYAATVKRTTTEPKDDQPDKTDERTETSWVGTWMFKSPHSLGPDTKVALDWKLSWIVEQTRASPDDLLSWQPPTNSDTPNI